MNSSKRNAIKQVAAAVLVIVLYGAVNGCAGLPGGGCTPGGGGAAGPAPGGVSTAVKGTLLTPLNGAANTPAVPAGSLLNAPNGLPQTGDVGLGNNGAAGALSNVTAPADSVQLPPGVTAPGLVDTTERRANVDANGFLTGTTSAPRDTVTLQGPGTQYTSGASVAQQTLNGRTSQPNLINNPVGQTLGIPAGVNGGTSGSQNGGFTPK